MRKTWLLIAALLAFGMGLTAAAHEGPHVEAARNARALAANCAACHGQRGRPQGAMPMLAGKPKDYLIERMLAFRAGKLQGTIMPQIARAYDERQIWLLADYFADQK